MRLCRSGEDERWRESGIVSLGVDQRTQSDCQRGGTISALGNRRATPLAFSLGQERRRSATLSRSAAKPCKARGERRECIRVNQIRLAMRRGHVVSVRLWESRSISNRLIASTDRRCASATFLITINFEYASYFNIASSIFGPTFPSNATSLLNNAKLNRSLHPSAIVGRFLRK
jgi:hypothetical protein